MHLGSIIALIVSLWTAPRHGYFSLPTQFASPNLRHKSGGPESRYLDRRNLAHSFCLILDFYRPTLGTYGTSLLEQIPQIRAAKCEEGDRR